MRPTQPPKLFDFCILLMLAAMWASSFGVMKILVVDMSPLAISTFRTAIGGLLILPFIIGKALPNKLKDWMIIAVVALLGNALPFTLIPLGETRVDSGLAGMLMAVGPIFALIFNHFFTKDDRATRRIILGVLLGLAGTALIFGEAIFSGQADQAPYILIIMLASISYVISGLFFRHLGHIDLKVLTCLCLLLATGFSAPIPYLIDRPYIHNFSWNIVFSIVYLGAIPTGCAFFLRFLIIRRTGYTFFSYVGYVIPALSLIFGLVFLDEIPSLEKLIALGLILFGLSLFSHQKKTPAKG